MYKVTDETTLKEFGEMMENIKENKWLDSFIEKRNMRGNAKKFDFLFGLLLNGDALEKYVEKYIEVKNDSAKPNPITSMQRNSYGYVMEIQTSKDDFFQEKQGLNEHSTIKDVSNKINEILKGQNGKQKEIEDLIKDLKKISNN